MSFNTTFSNEMGDLDPNEELENCHFSSSSSSSKSLQRAFPSMRRKGELEGAMAARLDIKADYFTAGTRRARSCMTFVVNSFSLPFFQVGL